MRTMMPNSSLTYSSERSIHYNNYEYTLYNRSKAGLVDYAAWEWSRDYDTNSKLWRNHKTCPLWCQDWFFNDNNFSPASYANFNPGFSATFFAPANKKGSSSFRLSASMRPVALGGRVQYRVLFQQYKPWGQSGDTINVDQLLTVNWDSQVFMLVTPVCLQMRHKDLCLNAREGDINGNAQVNLYKCRLLKSQLWYMDSSHRLMSQGTTERCLTQGESGKVQLQNCTIADNQKWYWNKDRLGNSHGCYLSYQNNGTIAISCDSDQAIEWSFQIKKPDLSDSLTTQIL